MSANPFGLPLVASLDSYRREVAQDARQELVNLMDFIPDLVLDIRYATAHNVLGEPLYQLARAYLRRPVAEALRRVQQLVKQRGLGLCVYDAYRPYSVTVRFYEQVQDETFAAPPWRGSRHNRGCSVDVGLVEYGTGQHVPLPTDFDDLTPAAHTRYSALPGHIILNRCVLLAAMRQHGFVNYPGEWWHFDYRNWNEFSLTDLPFEALEG